MITGNLNTLLYCLPPFTPTSHTTLGQCFSNWCSTETPGENGHCFLSSSDASSSYWLCLPKQGSPSLNALHFLSGANNIHSWDSKGVGPWTYRGGNGRTTIYHVPSEWPGTICVTVSLLCPTFHPLRLSLSREAQGWIKNRSSHSSLPWGCNQSTALSKGCCVQNIGESQWFQRSEGSRQNVSKV